MTDLNIEHGKCHEDCSVWTLSYRFVYSGNQNMPLKSILFIYVKTKIKVMIKYQDQFLPPNSTLLLAEVIKLLTTHQGWNKTCFLRVVHLTTTKLLSFLWTGKVTTAQTFAGYKTLFLTWKWWRGCAGILQCLYL